MSDAHSDTTSGSAGHGPALEEPVTPEWLPALGVFLFVAVGVWWAVAARSDAPKAEETEAPAAATAAPAASAPPPRPMATALAH